MGEQARPALPEGVQTHLDIVRDRLASLAEGAPTGEVLHDLDLAFDRAFEAALTAGQDKRSGKDSGHRLVPDFGVLIAERARRLREDAGWTQAQVAEAMTRLGFKWTRVTVAEVELGTRRVSMEELVGLAAMYGEPLLLLLTPDVGDRLEFPRKRGLDPADVVGLMLGEGGRIGPGGADWGPAARIALVREPNTASDWRPARALWERRTRGYGTGPRQLGEVGS